MCLDALLEKVCLADFVIGIAQNRFAICLGDFSLGLSCVSCAAKAIL
jgi:hypothetical protein